MPFGLTNAPSNFQRLMDNIFREFLYKDTTVYLDDLLTFANTIDRVFNYFDRNLGMLICAGLKCKPRKCQILPETLD